MARRLLLPLALAALLLLPGVARAQDGGEPTEEDLRERWEQLTPEEREEKLRLYEERWKNLSEEERRSRMELFDRLRALTPGEIAELRRKLKEIRRRNDLEELRRKSERIHALERKLLKEMPEDVREKLRHLAPGLRDQVVRHGVRAAVRQANQRFRRSLTEEERAALAGLEGEAKADALRDLTRAKAIQALPPEEREQLRALPDRKRRDRMERILHEATERQFVELRQSVSKELGSLLALSPEELGRRFPKPWRWRHRGGQPGGPRHR